MERVTVTTGGHSETVTVYALDEFTFESDGDFYSTEVEGTWFQKKRKFWVNIDPEEIEEFGEDFLEDMGYEAEITVTKSTLTGRESRDGSTISGKWAISMSLYIDEDYYDDYDQREKRPGKVKLNVIIQFTGTRAEFGEELDMRFGAKETKYADMLKKLLKSIVEQVVLPLNDR